MVRQCHQESGSISVNTIVSSGTRINYYDSRLILFSEYEATLGNLQSLISLSLNIFRRQSKVQRWVFPSNLLCSTFFQSWLICTKFVENWPIWWFWWFSSDLCGSQVKTAPLAEMSLFTRAKNQPRGEIGNQWIRIHCWCLVWAILQIIFNLTRIILSCHEKAL